ncbi:4-(cytidine 5'-diphospho)-2-C-methyl-D-erythritol kinase [Corynebacterium caspium]|uniref:4-(cytidine 5'-diphospho)-2-C-methyl-D-erythritol kinase n=1 Tax=Corynebacterium caspium TaxID=234828 RepID=UPI00036AE9AB|nr:4-(cytidine 5'-diphospho)-2-C-methyl-D-erythritol kinase [Corynebacterium caspium]WKD59600.1 4-diphosphocytidyl-2-C-methyl-D-erythritol kinase [Corynebacterium caspium DSM 44850]
MKKGTIRARAYGKINLFLGVGPVREDGYHQLETIFQAVDLAEDITITPAAELSLEITGRHANLVPTDDSNLVIKTYKRFNEYLAEIAHAPLPPLAITINKQVPVAGGMAGGSADAAAMLMALNALLDNFLSRAELLHIGSSLGADIPFCLIGGTARGTGRGDELVSVLAKPTTWVIALSHKHLSTPEVFKTYDRLQLPSTALPDSIYQALAKGHPQTLAKQLHNDLQPAALSLLPELKKAFQTTALASIVSGSGPTVAALCMDHYHADLVAEELMAENIPSLVVASETRGAHLI